MLGSGAFGQSYFGETFVLTRRPAPSTSAGIGGSGMSDEEYDELLRRLGAQPRRVTDDDLVEAVSAMRLMNVL